MKVPVVIHCRPGTAQQEVAGLNVADRLAVAAHRAGCDGMHLVSAEGPFPLRRTSDLKLPVQWHETDPKLSEPFLLLSTDGLVQGPDLRTLLASRGRLSDPEGKALPAAWVDPSGETEPEGIPIQGVGGSTLTGADRQRIEQRLWASLGSCADGWVDRYFNRPLGRPLSRVLVHTRVTPNAVSVFATLLGLAAGGLFATGQAGWMLAGALLLQVSAVIDCVDGELARITLQESPLGKWLDLGGDQVVHLTIFSTLGWGLHRMGTEAPVLALAGSAAVGVGLSFAVVLRGMLAPRPAGESRLQRLMDATTNRDFSVLLIVLAVIGQLEWFLWLAGIGVHIFWITALTLQCLPERGSRSESS